MAPSVASSRARGFWPALALVLLAILLSGAFNPRSTVISLDSLGAIGDGVSINNGIFQYAFTQVANGGKIRIPCGTYKLTTTPSVTVASNKHVDIQGDGMNCAVIFVSGAISGPTLTLADQTASFGISDLTIVSDQPGGSNCLVIQGTYTNATPANSVSSNISNVTFRGSDAFTTGTKYCGVGVSESGLSNIEMDNIDFSGIASRTGTAISLNGTSAANSVGILITNSTWTNCNIGVNYGDYLQNVQMSMNNIAGCANGVSTISSPSGTLSGLMVADNDFDTFTCGVCINATSFANYQLVDNQFTIEASARGVLLQGSTFALRGGNTFRGVTTSGTSGVVVGTTSGGGSIEGDFTGLATGITIQSTSAAATKIDHPRFLSNTADYSISSSSSGTVVDDTNPRTVSQVNSRIPCNSATKNSRVVWTDIVTASFNATVASGGGSLVMRGACDGTNWRQD